MADQFLVHPGPVGRPIGLHELTRVEIQQRERDRTVAFRHDQGDTAEDAIVRLSPLRVLKRVRSLPAQFFDARRWRQESRASRCDFVIELVAQPAQVNLQLLLQPFPFSLAQLGDPTVLNQGEGSAQHDHECHEHP